jgi:hypothetical protein
MTFRPHGRAEIDANDPQAFACCDRCGILYNLPDLYWQFQYVGPVLSQIKILVCNRCRDVPAEFLKTPILPADPYPVFNARPEAYAIDETDFRITQDDQQRITEDGDKRVLDNSVSEDIGA